MQRARRSLVGSPFPAVRPKGAPNYETIPLRGRKKALCQTNNYLPRAGQKATRGGYIPSGNELKANQTEALAVVVFFLVKQPANVQLRQAQQNGHRPHGFLEADFRDLLLLRLPHVQGLGAVLGLAL